MGGGRRGGVAEKFLAHMGSQKAKGGSRQAGEFAKRGYATRGIVPGRSQNGGRNQRVLKRRRLQRRSEMGSGKGGQRREGSQESSR